MLEALTILWTAAADDELVIVQAVARAEKATLLAATVETLSTCVTMALERGGVVAVTAGGMEATYAFRLGVDEVLSVGQITRRALERAIRRSRARAAARASRRNRARAPLADVTEGMTLLTTVLDQELSQPLLSAWDACAAIRHEFEHLARLADRLEQWAALVAPADELRTVTQMRTQALPGSVQRKLHDVGISLVRAEALITLLRDISALEAQRGCVIASSVAGQLRDLVGGYVSSWATLRVSTEGKCIAQMPRPVFVCILSALIARSVNAIRAAGQSPGEIELRVSEKSEQEATVLVEVFDNGEPEIAFASEVHASGNERGPSHPILVGLRERARQFGGELLVQSDDQGTTVRLFLPTPSAEAIAEIAAEPDLGHPPWASETSR